MFTDSELKICAQILLPIRHNLMAACPRDQIKKLYSIAQVFAQCRQWLQVNMPHVELVEVSSSTRAAELVRQEHESGIAEKANSGALASALAAEKYSLTIHDENIQDSSENVTRFLVIGRKCPARTGNDKTSIMFAAQDRVGALHDSLATFKRHKINLTKIESRPSKKKAWEYYFFVDCTGHCDDARVKKALAELAKHTMFVKILGSYPNVNG
jgi:chorismate mutase/prephenate dehydratase